MYQSLAAQQVVIRAQRRTQFHQPGWSWGSKMEDIVRMTNSGWQARLALWLGACTVSGTWNREGRLRVVFTATYPVWHLQAACLSVGTVTRTHCDPSICHLHSHPPPPERTHSLLKCSNALPSNPPQPPPGSLSLSHLSHALSAEPRTSVPVSPSRILSPFSRTQPSSATSSESLLSLLRAWRHTLPFHSPD